MRASFLPKSQTVASGEGGEGEKNKKTALPKGLLLHSSHTAGMEHLSFLLSLPPESLRDAHHPNQAHLPLVSSSFLSSGASPRKSPLQGEGAVRDRSVVSTAAAFAAQWHSSICSVEPNQMK